MSTKTNSLVSVIVIAIASAIMLGIGFFQMWKGYTHIAGSTAAFWASLVIVIILFSTNMAFRKALADKEEPQYIRRLLLAYLLFTLVSFSGNFNAFYSYFMNDDLISKEITEKNDRLHEIGESAKVALSDKQEVELTSTIKEKKKELEAQFRDPKNQGLGPEANKILKEIENLLNTNFTRLSNLNSIDELVVSYNQIIDDALEAKLEKDIPNKKEKHALVNEINQKIISLDPKIAEGRKHPQDQGLTVLNSIVETYKEIGNKVQNLVNDFKYDKNLEVQQDRVGTIPHSFSAAFGQNSNKLSTWFITLLSLFIDLGVPLFTYLVTKPSTKTDNETFFKPSN